MNLSRPGSEKKQPININYILENTGRLFRAHLKNNNINVDLKLSSKLPDREISPGQLSQVFMNLINNAAEAITGMSKPGKGSKAKADNGGTITITTNLVNDNIVIQVKDTGPGISREDREHIFDPFFTSKKTMGMGVGLSICHGIIEDHGGTIEAKNSHGRGAVFKITLPG